MRAEAIMLILPKKQEDAKQDAISWLLACHSRIHHFTSLAQKIASSKDASTQDIKEAAEAVHRYFTIALPLHEQDEEDSLLPRLFGRDPIIDTALSQMREEHRTIDLVVALLCSRMKRLMDGAPLHEVNAEIQTDATTLASLWTHHLTREEEVIFPFAEKVLSETQREELRQEMKSRRAS
jgi:hemerythrin-like domain-containing protein